MSGLSLAAMAAVVAITPSARPDTLAALEDEQTALFERVAPAVVAIRSGNGYAAGFAVAPGLVLTAAHALRGEGAIEVTLRDGRIVPGEVVERSPDGLDLALLAIPATPAALLELSAILDVRTGSLVAVVGHGDGSLWSLSTGVVSNVAAAGPDGTLLGLQIPLRPGASGGPVVDRRGRVVGIVAHGASGAVAFAVRSDAALRSLPRLAQILRELAGSATEVETAMAPPLRAPELVIGPADPRPADERRASVTRRVRARTPDPARRTGL